jgi:hypothetical protein
MNGNIKLYHVCRRSNSITAGQKLELINATEIEDAPSFVNECFNEMKNTYYKEGLSEHGMHYFTTNNQNNSRLIDVIFEYERLLNYSDKLSRYQSFFALDKDSLIDFIKRYTYLTDDYKVFEVKSDYYERHNMNLLFGSTHCVVSSFAKKYWSDSDYDKDVKPLYEYLLKFPVEIVREVSIDEIKEGKL